MKKIALVLALAVAAGLALAACSGVGHSQPGGSTATSAQQPGAENQINGTIVDITEHTITIELETGETFTFTVKDADKTEAESLLLGTSVTVFYIGEIVGTNTSGVTVTKLVQATEISVPSS